MKVLIAGDFCPTERLKPIVESGDYHSIFCEVESVIKSADYSIVNYECPVVLGNYSPIEKCGPNLASSAKGIDAIKYAGFNIVTLANNHIMDFGDQGLTDTIKTCEKENVDTVGAGANLKEAARILYKRKGNETLAIINCCEHEFSIATDNSAGANPLNPIQQYYQIKEARQNADYVLVIVHGGHEHYQLPSPRMVETYRFFIDAGADVVVNHHQHCFSGYEMYKDKPIFYGLGNFCFDNVNRCGTMWNNGILLILDIDKSIQFKIIPYIQNNKNVGIQILDNTAYNEQLTNINHIIKDISSLKQNFSELVKSKKKFNDYLFEPYKSPICKKLYYRNLLPNLFSHNKKIILENIVCCESHKDILEIYFKNINKSHL